MGGALRLARPTACVVRKRHFLSHLYIKCMILPRQARDKHRENSKKVPFSRRLQHLNALHIDAVLGEQSSYLPSLPFASLFSMLPPYTAVSELQRNGNVRSCVPRSISFSLSTHTLSVAGVADATYRPEIFLSASMHPAASRSSSRCKNSYYSLPIRESSLYLSRACLGNAPSFIFENSTKCRFSRRRSSQSCKLYGAITPLMWRLPSGSSSSCTPRGE